MVSYCCYILAQAQRRTDKMHKHFGELMGYLEAKNYRFVRVDELLEGE